ncbi:hypothetical protein SBA3_1860037 [Candidatus Sulfopaludibacter sp. SbA3]|nr:hypothetical protein SBA3_1860037 [Candidatus Sulfopaludibacter sp. SbA3]
MTIDLHAGNDVAPKPRLGRAKVTMHELTDTTIETWLNVGLPEVQNG